MLEYTRNAIAVRVDHPLMFLMYIVAALLAVSAGAVEAMVTLEMIDWRMGAAFLGVFAIFFAILGTTGYILLFAGKALSRALDSVGP